MVISLSHKFPGFRSVYLTKSLSLRSVSLPQYSDSCVLLGRA